MYVRIGSTVEIKSEVSCKLNTHKDACYIAIDNIDTVYIMLLCYILYMHICTPNCLGVYVGTYIVQQAYIRTFGCYLH